MDIVAFYRGEKPDYKGRPLEHILTFRHGELEMCHDYIQVLFPLEEVSMFNAHAPILTEDNIKAFHNDELLRENLIRAFKVMLDFYGFSLETHYNGTRPYRPMYAIEVVPSDKYNERINVWCYLHDHNMRRITRILKCLATLGCKKHAIAFFNALSKLYNERQNQIGETAFRFWREAIN